MMVTVSHVNKSPVSKRKYFKGYLQNRKLGVPVQLCFGVEVSFKVPHQIAVGTAKCPAELPVNWHSLTILGYVGSFN
jgi:hypothetical protein